MSFTNDALSSRLAKLRTISEKFEHNVSLLNQALITCNHIRDKGLIEIAADKQLYELAIEEVECSVDHFIDTFSVFLED